MFELNKNTIALSVVSVITLFFFLAGVFEVLNYVIVKLILIGLVVALGAAVSVILFKSSLIENRPEDELQDDSN